MPRENIRRDNLAEYTPLTCLPIILAQIISSARQRLPKARRRRSGQPALLLFLVLLNKGFEQFLVGLLEFIVLVFAVLTREAYLFI